MYREVRAEDLLNRVLGRRWGALLEVLPGDSHPTPQSCLQSFHLTVLSIIQCEFPDCKVHFENPDIVYISRLSELPPLARRVGRAPRRAPRPAKEGPPCPAATPATSHNVTLHNVFSIT